MSRTFEGLATRKVKWRELRPTMGDAKTLYLSEKVGIVLETHWDQGQCYCVVADKDGVLWLRPATELTLHDSPLSSTSPKSTSSV